MGGGRILLARPAQGGNGGGGVAIAVDRAARHQHIGPGPDRLGGGAGIDAAVHLQLAGGVVALDEGADLADGVQLGLQEALAAEAGLHRHHQHQVQLGQIGEDGLRLGDGPQGHRLLHPALPHEPQGLGNVVGVVGLQVDGEQVGPRLGEGLHIPHRLFDHQVHVQEHVGALPDGPHHRHADGEVRHEGAVHHVHVEVVGGGHPADVPLQIDKIGREDGGRNFNHLFTHPLGRL